VPEHNLLVGGDPGSGRFVSNLGAAAAMQALPFNEEVQSCPRQTDSLVTQLVNLDAD